MLVQAILLSIIGTLSGFQMLDQLHSLRVISRQTLARARKIFVPAAVFLTFLMRRQPLSCLFLMMSLHLAPVVFMVLNRYLRKRHFQREIVPFLDELLLKMRSGVSFRESLAEAAHQSRGCESLDLAEISSLIRFPDRGQRLVLIAEAQELLVEMRKMDRATARVAEKLRAYRKKEKMVQRFRQKSSQVTSQARAQALVCTFLYVALLAWTGFTEPEALFSAPAGLSYLLFAIGLAGMKLIVRSFRWKL